MPLPVTITGISTAAAPVGPFKLAAGTYSTFSFETSSTSANSNGATGAVLNHGQTITTVGAISLRQTNWYLSTDTTFSTTVTANVEVRSGSFSGTLLGTSNTLDISSLSFTTVPLSFIFPSPISLSASTQYFFTLSVSGATVDNCYVAGNATDTYAGGAAYFVTSGIPSSIRNVAPFDYRVVLYSANIRASDAYYFFGRDSTTATTLQAFKSTAPDTSWASAATKTGFTTAILNIAGYQSGSTIHLLVQDGTMSSSVATKYVSYDMGTDTFLTTTETVSAAAILTGSATSGWGCSLIVRSSGEVVAFYNGVQTKVSTQWSRVYYRRRTAVNTYGTETIVDAGLWVNNTAPIAVLGASDRVHFLFYNATNTLQRHLTSANVLGTVASTGATAATLDACTFDDSGTTRHVGFTPAQTIRWASADNPTVTAAAVTFGTPTRTADDGTDVYALYQNSTDSDLYLKKSTDRGATFDAGTDVFTATVAAVDANLSKNQLAYQSGAIVFPYVVNDNGTLKYNEAVIRTIVTTKALPLFSTPRKFAARHF